MINLEETAKFKELERISVGTKKVGNINGRKTESANLNESMKTKAKDKDMIITDGLLVLLIKKKLGIMLKEIAT